MQQRFFEDVYRGRVARYRNHDFVATIDTGSQPTIDPLSALRPPHNFRRMFIAILPQTNIVIEVGDLVRKRFSSVVRVGIGCSFKIETGYSS